jgi:hypothetical protein
MTLNQELNVMKIVLPLLFAGLLQGCQPDAGGNLRKSISQIVGKTWSDRLLGEEEAVMPEVELPEIPQVTRNSTDVGVYNKPDKRPVEYDHLPPARKRDFDFAFLQELFLVTRKTEAHDEDLSNWLNTLDQGGSREGVYQALVLDEVYAALENMSEPPSPALLKFVQENSRRFLNQSYKEEALQKLNLYSLKRIMTEKVLDLMEHFETRNLEDLYRWYAVFSAELGANHERVLRNPVRVNSSPAFHLAWAQEMPIQHIKSEMIIKLHTVMNGLQN